MCASELRSLASRVWRFALFARKQRMDLRTPDLDHFSIHEEETILFASPKS